MVMILIRQGIFNTFNILALYPWFKGVDAQIRRGNII